MMECRRRSRKRRPHPEGDRHLREGAREAESASTGRVRGRIVALTRPTATRVRLGEFGERFGRGTRIRQPPRSSRSKSLQDSATAPVVPQRSQSPLRTSRGTTAGARGERGGEGGRRRTARTWCSAVRAIATRRRGTYVHHDGKRGSGRNRRGRPAGAAGAKTIAARRSRRADHPLAISRTTFRRASQKERRSFTEQRGQWQGRQHRREDGRRARDKYYREVTRPSSRGCRRQ